MKKIKINNVNLEIPLKKKDINNKIKKKFIFIQGDFLNNYKFIYNKSLISNINKITSIEIKEEEVIFNNAKVKKYKLKTVTKIIESINPFIYIEINKNECKIIYSKKIFENINKIKTISFH